MSCQDRLGTHTGQRSQLFRCPSRACVGKMFVFIYKWFVLRGKWHRYVVLNNGKRGSRFSFRTGSFSGTLERTTSSLSSLHPPRPGPRALRIKTVFLSHLYLKTNILPRQARAKHREGTQKRESVLPARNVIGSNGLIHMRNSSPSCTRDENALRLLGATSKDVCPEPVLAADERFSIPQTMALRNGRVLG